MFTGVRKGETGGQVGPSLWRSNRLQGGPRFVALHAGQIEGLGSRTNVAKRGMKWRTEFGGGEMHTNRKRRERSVDEGRLTE